MRSKVEFGFVSLVVLWSGGCAAVACGRGAEAEPQAAQQHAQPPNSKEQQEEKMLDYNVTLSSLSIALRVHAALALLESVISVSPCQTY